MRSMERHFSKLHILSTNKFIRSSFLFAFSVRHVEANGKAHLFWKRNSPLASIETSIQTTRLYEQALIKLLLILLALRGMYVRYVKLLTTSLMRSRAYAFANFQRCFHSFNFSTFRSALICVYCTPFGSAIRLLRLFYCWFFFCWVVSCEWSRVSRMQPKYFAFAMVSSSRQGYLVL